MPRPTRKRTQSTPELLPAELIEQRIYVIRGQRVMLDSDLARLYGVQTRVLTQAVKRNRQRFPKDFIFQLNNQEATNLKSQSVISSSWGGRRRSLPHAFTEHGAVMAATVLNSPVAVEASILIVRAFIHAREILAGHADLKRQLERIERQMTSKFADHEEELQTIRLLIDQLMLPPETKKKHPLGFRRRKE